MKRVLSHLGVFLWKSFGFIALAIFVLWAVSVQINFTTVAVDMQVEVVSKNWERSITCLLVDKEKYVVIHTQGNINSSENPDPFWANEIARQTECDLSSRTESYDLGIVQQEPQLGGRRLGDHCKLEMTIWSSYSVGDTLVVHNPNSGPLNCDSISIKP